MKTGVFPFERYLREYDVWEFHPLDQGGRLVQLQLIGSEKDADIVAALRRPDFFAPWGEPIQWDRLESAEVEKSVWLNRWYFLPSFARLYWLTGERAYLDDLLKFFRRWTSDNPVPSDLPGYFASRRYNWRDMQVAWRTQNLIWCFFLGRSGFSESEQQELLGSVETHARVLTLYFGQQPLSAGNHQSHGALAMLHAALLLPDLADPALKILNHHLEAAFFADGNSVELCPGYYPFIAANFRNAYLLCSANGIALPARWRDRLAQCYRFMRDVQQPDGTMPPINDSSEMPARLSLRILGDMLEMEGDAKPTGSVRFAESNQAIMRNEASYLFLDAAGSSLPFHWHAGKLGFHYWHGDRPYLVDSGVCNYDERLRKEWYLTARAHNTILIDGTPADGVSRISEWEHDHATMTTGGNGVHWKREILLLKRGGLIVMDSLQSAAVHDYTWLFHFVPTTLKTDAPNKRLLTGFADRNLCLAPFDPRLFSRMEIIQGHVNKGSRNVSAPVGHFSARASDLAMAFLILPTTGSEFPKIELEQLADGWVIRTDAMREVVHR